MVDDKQVWLGDGYGGAVPKESVLENHKAFGTITYSVKNAKSGRCAYLVNGSYYSTFDTNFNKFNEGDKVIIEFQKRGQFFNIVNMDYYQESTDFRTGQDLMTRQQFLEVMGKIYDSLVNKQ